MEHSVYSDPSASPDINTAKMGIIQSLPIDSYLDRHQCSGRNITWHYIHTNGSLPAPYSHCPDLSAILSSHCCSHGTCAPSWFDREFERYGYGKWDGLGDPYNRLTNCTIGNWNSGTIKSNSTAENWNNDITNSSDSTAGRSKNMYHGMKKGGMCLGMEPWLWFIKNHWPPLGVDGRPVKNFEAMKWGDLATDTYGGETRAPAVGWNASVRSGGLDARTVTSNAERRAAGALWGMPAEWLAVARSLHKHKRDDIWIFGVVVAVVILIFVVVRNSFPESLVLEYVGWNKTAAAAAARVIANVCIISSLQWSWNYIRCSLT
jgi:hypothetical protein